MRILIAAGLLTLATLHPMGLSAQTAPAFEATDVRPSPPALNPFTFVSGGVLRGERYDLRKATLLDLIRVAYAVEPQMIFGGPNSLEFDRFDIAAKAPASSSQEAIRQMLQTLLADRFQLVLHKDTRPLPVYALTVMEGKPKLTPANREGNPQCQFQQQPSGSTGTLFSCRNITMAFLADRLRGMANDYLVDPVVDSTALSGTWDLDLKWNRRSETLPAGVPRTTIFAALEKQLGLALIQQKAPAPVLVIDRVNEKPRLNASDIARTLPPREVEFEVADLKPSQPVLIGNGIGLTRGGGLDASGVEMKILLATAFDVDWDHPERFANLPGWAETARFDIHAKPSVNTTDAPFRGAGFLDDDVRLMLRNLLIERFQIKFHNEDRVVNAYALTAGKPKMSKADSANRAHCQEARTVSNDPRDANPKLSRLVTCQNVTMAQLAAQLQPLAPDYFGYPVEDATGLTGGWDFTLSFSPSWMLRSANPANPDATVALSLADAINKQLGLKLESRKRSLPVIVIDQIEEKPTGN